MHQRSIPVQEIGQPIRETESRGSVDAERRTGFHQKPCSGRWNPTRSEPIGPAFAYLAGEIGMLADEGSDGGIWRI